MIADEVNTHCTHSWNLFPLPKKKKNPWTWDFSACLPNEFVSSLLHSHVANRFWHWNHSETLLLWSRTSAPPSCVICHRVAVQLTCFSSPLPCADIAWPRWVSGRRCRPSRWHMPTGRSGLCWWWCHPPSNTPGSRSWRGGSRSCSLETSIWWRTRAKPRRSSHPQQKQLFF